MTKRERLNSAFFVFERKVFHWFIGERYKIVLIVLIALIMWGSSFLPYLNLVINTPLIVFVAIVLSLVLFKVPPERIILLALVLFLPALLGVLLEEQTRMEMVGAYIYGILLLGSVLTLLKPRK